MFSEDYLRSKLLRSASEEGLNIPSTPEFSFDGNLEGGGAGPAYRRQSSRLVSPTSPVSESESSYHGSARYAPHHTEKNQNKIFLIYIRKFR
jgi:hypothetical protein